MSEAAAALTIDNVSKAFGGVQAIAGVSFDIREGSLSALIGPNGAGKSTMFNLLTNLYITDTGKISYFGQDLAGLRSDKIARLGLIRTFQTARVYAGMTVLENVLAGAHIACHAAVWEQSLSLPHAVREERAVRDKALHLLDLLGLADYAETGAVSLPLGLQKLLEIARALMTSPRVLLLDEPAAGLNDTETLRLAELLSAVHEAGVTMVVVEHNMSLVMSISQDIVVLDAGRVIARGTPAAVQADERVIEAYVGRPDDAVKA
jgi:branched-chain amino acid transport system ATP-binding protein